MEKMETTVAAISAWRIFICGALTKAGQCTRKTYSQGRRRKHELSWSSISRELWNGQNIVASAASQLFDVLSGTYWREITVRKHICLWSWTELRLISRAVERTE